MVEKRSSKLMILSYASIIFTSDIVSFSFTFRYASNIVFSNGLMDPWSGGGVLRSMNNEIVIIIIPDTAHHLDLRESNPNDPQSVVQARELEKAAITRWLKSDTRFY